MIESIKLFVSEFSQNLKIIEEVYSGFVEFTKVNPVVGGVFGAWLLTTTTYILKSVPMRFFELLKRYLTVSITFNSEHESFHYFLKWIAKNKDVNSFRTTRVTNGVYGYDNTTTSIGIGNHYMFFKKFPVKVNRNIESYEGSKTKESITITTVGVNQKILTGLVEDIVPKKKEIKSTYLFQEGSWDKESDLPKRNWDSVILKEGQKDRILKHVEDFNKSKDWYEKMGISFQTGILLEGPPGTGKTSFVKALACKLNYNLAVLKCGELTDKTFEQSLARVPENTIVLMEDFDSIKSTQSRETKGEDGLPIFESLTLSGILNAIDGVFTSEGRILIATTNVAKDLDSAILRPGRFDLVEHLGYSNEDMVERMYKKFYEKTIKVNKVIGEVSSAKVENCFLDCKHDPEKAKENLSKLVELGE